eukprot:CAMPEP_0194249498 /NCGR_PEP_ID=MMETSP0158-20130606/20615_1 /TAXON_ID=33649 /ORGANISM="Thalassionema nitzschioides, Strain L26-B" /LENGTH=425 /DNA_ID=CAMNT_0038986025 /DNA_START=37 /DNA_END=1314 /DNA_ORIENTATION=+
MMKRRKQLFVSLLILWTLTILPFAFAFSSPKTISRQEQQCQHRRRATTFTRRSPILRLTTPDNKDGEIDHHRLDGDACVMVDPEEDAQLWTWRVLLLAITGLWGANFAIVKQAADVLGSGEAITLFTAGRFVIGAALLSPALFQTSSKEVIQAGVRVGALTTFGYAAQTAAVSMGTQAGTAAFICSLNSVVVAIIIGQKTGCVSPRTWWAIALSVLGVACLELPAMLAGGGASFCLGDLVAFGQPIGFGVSYVLLEQALADHPEDELPIAATQVLVTCLTALAAASFVYGGVSLWELPWGTLFPAAAESSSSSTLAGFDWTVTGPLIYSGAITSGLTIWLQMVVFSKLTAVDASLLMTTEPLWALLSAVLLLGDGVGLSDCVGGSLIIFALIVQQGLIFNGENDTPDVGPRLAYDMTVGNATSFD